MLSENCSQKFIKVSSQLRISTDLRDALKNSKIDVYYQPKIQVQTGQIIGFEALARWVHPSLGNIPPEVFIRIAEQTGQIKELTSFVLQSVATQQQAWSDLGLSFPISINVSAAVFLEPLFVESFLQFFKTHHLSPNCYDLEITETAFVAFPERLTEAIRLIRSSGFRIYIDDFGVGFSSFSRLSSLPVDGLKIDKTFLRNAHQHRNAFLVLESIISLSKKLRIESVMEGVETEQDLLFLQTIGCDAAQGFLISAPMDSGEAVRWLQRRKNLSWHSI
ncbi:diguanylate phosphodiesterase [Delftia sp. Cs1-4]|jgi:EAL domain-containing protein (putative c-di-GMP-specific phosphodiesterase class I)|uniref:EAL domain-containing protein n=1 Tax=Delftia TaxID=80865 RepID=UPI00020E80D8|nr:MULTISPECIES: EAL domain-containing protein [Delftia]AEF90118.1 diguanylate phosphodiesterase [Delftia sp. Cs1-4]